MLHVDFAESYKNDMKYAIQSAYFGNQCFSIFTECFYAESSNKNGVRNDNVIAVTECSDHNRIASMSCLQKVVHKIKHMLEKTYENAYVWSDRIRLQSTVIHKISETNSSSYVK